MQEWRAVATARTLFFADCIGAFQGGGCRAAAFAGAFEAASDAGVHFGSVVGTSAGAIMAALIGAGASPADVTNSLRELQFPQLLRDPEGPPASRTLAMLLWAPRKLRHVGRLLLYGGLYSSAGIEEWVEETLGKVLPLSQHPIRFRDLRLPTWIVATDLRTGQLRQWSPENTPDESVSHAVRASCSVPLFFQPVDGQFVDGGALSNLPTFLFADDAGKGQRRVLAFSLSPSERRPLSGSSAIATMSALAETVVSGSQEIQLRLQPRVHIVDINTGGVRATDFDTIEPKTVEWLIEQGRLRTREFLRAERIQVQPERTLERAQDRFQTLAELAELFLHAQEAIIVSDTNTSWVFELFPAFAFGDASPGKCHSYRTPPGRSRGK